MMVLRVQLSSIVRNLVMVLLVGLGAIALAQLSPPCKLPQFKLKGSDGKSYSLSTLSKRNPVLLVFLHDDDDALPRGVKDMNRLAKLLAGKMRVVGVMPNRDVSTVRRFTETHGVKFLVLAGGTTLLNQIGEKNGVFVLTTAAVLPDGTLAARESGYSEESLADMIAKAAKLTGRKISVKLSGYPKTRFRGEIISFGLIPP